MMAEGGRASGVERHGRGHRSLAFLHLVLQFWKLEFSLLPLPLLLWWLVLVAALPASVVNLVFLLVPLVAAPRHYVWVERISLQDVAVGGVLAQLW